MRDVICLSPPEAAVAIDVVRDQEDGYGHLQFTCERICVSVVVAVPVVERHRQGGAPIAVSVRVAGLTEQPLERRLERQDPVVAAQILEMAAQVSTGGAVIAEDEQAAPVAAGPPASGGDQSAVVEGTSRPETESIATHRSPAPSLGPSYAARGSLLR